MAIKIENFEHVTNPNIKKKEQSLDKEKYIKFLIEKGLEECAGFTMTYKSLKRLYEDSALIPTEERNGHIDVIDSSIFYYDTVMPALIAGDYELVSKYSTFPEEEIKRESRTLRRKLIANLDEKYGELYQ